MVILASSSPYRKILLETLHLTFECISADIDETPKPGETANDLVRRLSIEKGRTVAEAHPDKVIISADTVGTLHDQILTKPGTVENTRAQILAASGEWTRYYTSVCVTLGQENRFLEHSETYDVKYRTLSEKEVDNYLKKEQPIHCAGGLKAEGFGIVLLEELRGRDYSALIGLPLMSLSRMLPQFGIDII